jgi:hypothetical protein
MSAWVQGSGNAFQNTGALLSFNAWARAYGILLLCAVGGGQYGKLISMHAVLCPGT